MLRGTVRLPGQVGSQGLEVPGSLLLGTICCVQGSHVAGGCDQVDDTDEGLEQGDRGCDPEAHSEKTYRANCGKGARAIQRKQDAGEGGAFVSPGRPDPLPSSCPAPHLLPKGPSEKLNR